MTARVAFRQDDLTRACRGMKAAGYQVARVEIEPDGKITILTGEPGSMTPAPAGNAWDQDLDGEATN